MTWARLAALALAAAAGLWLLARVPVFHRAYTEHQQRLDVEAWLRDQCADPEFSLNMRRHTTACDDARAAFARPAWLVGLHACLQLPPLSWEAVALAGLLMLLGPTVVLPALHARHERLEHYRVLADCSPALPIHWRYAEDGGAMTMRHRHHTNNNRSGLLELS